MHHTQDWDLCQPEIGGVYPGSEDRANVENEPFSKMNETLKVGRKVPRVPLCIRKVSLMSVLPSDV